jgi:hypothetical protein
MHLVCVGVQMQKHFAHISKMPTLKNVKRKKRYDCTSTDVISCTVVIYMPCLSRRVSFVVSALHISHFYVVRQLQRCPS